MYAINRINANNDAKGILKILKIVTALNSSFFQSFVTIFHKDLSSDPTNSPPRIIKPIPPCMVFNFNVKVINSYFSFLLAMAERKCNFAL